MFDILITIAQKDFNKFRFVVDSIKKNIIGYDKIYCVSDIDMPFKIKDVQYFTDDIIGFNFGKIKMTNRQGWYRQQFIKLFQEVTSNNYLVVDADAYINKPYIIDVAHPYFLFGKNQFHIPYFTFLKEVLNLDKVYPHSFISETMFFKRSLIQFMLSEMGVNENKFFDLCVNKINEIGDMSSFSEYEMYGNFVTKYWPELYRYKNIKVLHQAKKRLWTEREIESYIKKYSNSDYDLLTMHTWI